SDIGFETLTAWPNKSLQPTRGGALPSALRRAKRFIGKPRVVLYRSFRVSELWTLGLIRATTLPIVLSAAVLLLFGCSSPPKDTHWRTADEESFTVEIPTWLQKQ